MKKILVLGAGAMGSAFTVPCAENRNEISLIGTHLEDELVDNLNKNNFLHPTLNTHCLLYTSDAADDSLRVDLGGRRIIKK